MAYHRRPFGLADGLFPEHLDGPAGRMPEATLRVEAGMQRQPPVGEDPIQDVLIRPDELMAMVQSEAEKPLERFLRSHPLEV